MKNTSIALPYHHSTIPLVIPDDMKVDIIKPPVAKPAANPEGMEKQRLLEFFKAHPQLAKSTTVAIGVNDKTRPVPYDRLLPPLLDALHELGIGDQQITFVIATGTHAPVPQEEIDQLFPPDLVGSCRVITHDCDDSDNLLFLGKTNRGTNVYVNKPFYQAELRIVVGNIEPHHFMGFSGGAKTASIGLTGRQTIADNQSMITHPNAALAHYDDNPMRQDVEDIGKLIGVQLAVNAIIDEEFRILEILVGEPLDVMAHGIPIVRKTCMTKVSHSYDLVIGSAGGYPKDINLYQAQKGLTHAIQVLRDGGVAILVAACTEGIGSAGYEAFVRGEPSQAAVMEKFMTSGFKIGPHKAFQMARQALRVNIIIVSEIPEADIRSLLLTPAASLDSAIASALAMLPPMPRVAVLPYATHTLAEVED